MWKIVNKESDKRSGARGRTPTGVPPLAPPGLGCYPLDCTSMVMTGSTSG
jgi:hypothetical protein